MSGFPRNSISDWRIRIASDADLPFILSLTPRLSGVPRPAWHNLADMVTFQDRFMKATLLPQALGAATYIAISAPNDSIGYVHVQPGTDGVTDEPCGYVSLLAVKEGFEGAGVATSLMKKAEEWAREQGYRLLSLDVFATNARAVKFYESAGFGTETIRLVKTL